MTAEPVLRVLALAVGASWAASGCGPTHEDARRDGGADVGATDAHPQTFDASRDGGVCVTPLLTARCQYLGYGSRCPVACALPADCSFDVDIDWGSDFCCASDGRERWRDCRCVAGSARCVMGWDPGQTRNVPSTTCEFCPADDAGRPDPADAATEPDGGDPSDAGT